MDGGSGLALQWVRDVLSRAPAIGREWSDRELKRFFTGRSNGDKLLHAIYDEVLEEPVPSRLATVMKEPASKKS
jgi:hypothetical protein